MDLLLHVRRRRTTAILRRAAARWRMARVSQAFFAWVAEVQEAKRHRQEMALKVGAGVMIRPIFFLCVGHPGLHFRPSPCASPRCVHA